MSESSHSDLAVKKEAGEPNGQPPHRGPTDPRTELGKKTSSKNAVKFGIFPRATFLKGESHSEYRSLLEGLWKMLQPEGKLEKLLVEKLASIAWRYQRLLVAEGAEIRKKSEFPAEINQERQVGMAMAMSLEIAGLISRVDSSEVLERCLELLVELGQGIKANGLDEERDRSLLRTIYGDPDMPHFRPTLHDEYSTWLNIASVTEEERARKGYATPEQYKEQALRGIDAEIVRLKEDQKKREPIQSERKKVEILRQSVPDSPGLDRLLRYESSLERAFDRTLTQLDRAQRMRKGQPVLSPVKVDISL